MKILLFLAVSTTTISSCHHVYYAPNTPSAPLLTKKHDVRINGLYASGGESQFNGAELQLAYAPSSHFGVMFNSLMAGQKSKVMEYPGSGKGRYAEFAGGYFNRIDEQWVFEAYGGFGGGIAKNDYGMGDHSTIGVTKFFIQPAIAFKSRHFEMAFVPRFGIVNWKDKQSSVKHVDNDFANYDLASIRAKPSFFSFEPSFILRVGSEHVKLQYGLAFCNAVSQTFSGVAESNTMSIGISVSFNTRKNK